MTFVSLDELAVDGEAHANWQYSISRLLTRIHRLQPPDRQIMPLYLEDESAAAIAEVTGLSPQNVANRIHRIKRHKNCARPSRAACSNCLLH